MILFTYPVWLLFLLALLAGGLSYFLYFAPIRDKSRYSKTQRIFLSALRFLSVFFLLIFLLKPLIRYTEKVVDRPVLPVLFDNSRSIALMSDSAQMATFYAELQSKLSAALGDKVDIVPYFFGDLPKHQDNAAFTEVVTDLSEAMNGAVDMHKGQHVGAMLLVSDGLYNVGSNPLYASQRVGVPIYAIGVGDTSTIRDGGIANIVHNRIAFEGNQFEVEVQLQFEALQGEQLQASLVHNGTVLAKKKVTVTKPQQFTDWNVLVEAPEKGLQEFQLRLQTVSDERIVENNMRTFYVDVIEGKQKVLLLAATAHPDVAMISRVLRKQQNFEVEVNTLVDFNEVLQESPASYQLIILHGLPQVSFNMRPLQTWLGKTNTSLWSIVGPLCSGQGLSQLGFPITFRNQPGQQQKSGAVMNQDFSLFTTTEDFLKENAQNLPPLASPFANYEGVFSSGQPVLYQRIGTVSTTYPLWSFAERNGRKFGVTFGTGLWRWRMFEYTQAEQQVGVDELIVKTVQYLSVKERKKRFDVQYEKQILANQKVQLQAFLYNKSYEPIITEEVSLTLYDGEENSYDYAFVPSGDRYDLTLGNLPSGKYRFEATTLFEGEELVEKGQFSVEKVTLESSVLQANHTLLQSISEQTGGAFYSVKGMDELVTALDNNASLTPTYHIEKRLEDLIQLRWLIAIAIILWTIEWFLRKRWGVI